LDKGSHSVKLYTDIDGHWLSGDANSGIHWSVGLNAKKQHNEKDVVSHIVEKNVHGRFSEWSDRAEWGQLFWTTEIVHLPYICR
jgi:hypothetical protein